MEAVVVDAGSKLLKIGFASPDQDPALIMPTKMKRVVEDGDGGGDVSMVEEETVDPVVRGFIRDWDAMEDLLRHVLYIDLGWEVGDEGQILFAEPLFTPKAIREQLVQLMFETFNVSGFYASEQVVLSLYAVGRISGCTVDIGHGKIDIAPVCEGAVQHIASKRFQIGGIDLTNLLAQKLQKSNPLVKIDISEVEKLKEQYARCAEDQTSFEETESKCPTETHTLPDGQTITIGREGYIVGEALFEPSILGIEEYGIVEQLVRSISSVSSENLRQLLENTMLCGGTASMTGFEERFQKEANLCSSSIRPSLIKLLMIIKGLFRRYERWNPVHPTIGTFWGLGIGVGCGVGWGPGFGPEVIGYVGAGCGVGFSVGITLAGIGVGLPQHLPHNGPFQILYNATRTKAAPFDAAKSSTYRVMKGVAEDSLNFAAPHISFLRKETSWRLSKLKSDIHVQGVELNKLNTVVSKKIQSTLECLEAFKHNVWPLPKDR